MTAGKLVSLNQRLSGGRIGIVTDSGKQQDGVPLTRDFKMYGFRSAPRGWSDEGLGMTLTGKIVRFDEGRGYGFIAPDNGDEDVFVHANELGEDKYHVSTGTPVQFEVMEGERGLKAFGVSVLDKSPADGASPSAASGRGNDNGKHPVSSVSSFSHQITEELLRADPSLTGKQILAVRSHLVDFARRQGWIK